MTLVLTKQSDRFLSVASPEQKQLNTTKLQPSSLSRKFPRWFFLTVFYIYISSDYVNGIGEFVAMSRGSLNYLKSLPVVS